MQTRKRAHCARSVFPFIKKKKKKKKKDVHHRVNEGCKVLGALRGVMKNRGLGDEC